MVNLIDIGLNDNALFCYTNLNTCCRSIDNPIGGSQGSWMFPEGNAVGSLNGADNNVFTRNRNERALVLHRGINCAVPTGIFTPHAQRERGKVIGRGVHIYICLWSKKIFESYFRDRLTFSNVHSRTSR